MTSGGCWPDDRAVLPAAGLRKRRCPGSAKTRLCPPATLHQAAEIAAAALLDTLDAVWRYAGAAPVVAMTGDLGAASRRAEIERALRHVTVIPQRGRDFGARLANAHADAAAVHAGLPVLQIGMDTPQVDLAVAGLGKAPIAGRHVRRSARSCQGRRLVGAGAARPAIRSGPRGRPDVPFGHRRAHPARAAPRPACAPGRLPILSDVDTMADAHRVRDRAPDGRFAACCSGRFRAGGLRMTAIVAGTEFDRGLLGHGCWLELTNGERIELPVERWTEDSGEGDDILLDACTGPTLDIGCGPGRLTAALAGRGLAALGVDSSHTAVRLTRRRGAIALRRNVFDRSRRRPVAAHTAGRRQYRHRRRSRGTAAPSRRADRAGRRRSC